MPQYYDVGVNLSDGMFKGFYNGRLRHKPDFEKMLQRAKRYHVDKMLLTGSSLEESKWTLEQQIRLSGQDGFPIMHSTVGVHPCAVMEFESDPESHLNKLRELINENLPYIRAFGEIGLDYDRLQFTPGDKQRKYFEMQLKLACEFNLPLFLHMRSACDDFLEILEPFVNGTRGDGLQLQNKNVLIHSFSGTASELEYLLSHPTFRVSVNGCSLKTEANCQTAALIPLDRLLLETDSPWCETKRTHWGYKYISAAPSEFFPDDREFPVISKNDPGKVHPMLPLASLKPERVDQFTQEIDYVVKARNEPLQIGFIAQIMAAIKLVDPKKLIDICYKNSEELFDQTES